VCAVSVFIIPILFPCLHARCFVYSGVLHLGLTISLVLYSAFENVKDKYSFPFH